MNTSETAISKEMMLKLQNGSDIRGIACEGIAGEDVTLTKEAAFFIGQAFAVWILEKKDLTPEKCAIGIGTDSRITASEVKESLMRGILSQDVFVVDCGMASTPAMFMSIVYPETNYDASCMITASHLPFNRNGFKFFDDNGGLEKQDITEILTLASQFSLEAEDSLQALFIPLKDYEQRMDEFDLISLYSANLCYKIRESVSSNNYSKPLTGLKIIVDAGNGAGGFFVTKVLNELGADTSGSQFLEPDGMFPNHAPNPENKAAMSAICDAVIRSHADLGLIFDTDVDRMSAVLSDGTPLNRDAIIAMMAAILAPDYPGSTIVTDSVTSDRLTDFLENHLGLRHLCFKRGYKNVINKCIELNESGITCPLAMETSGHGCLAENYYLDDGAFLAVKLVIAVAREAKEGHTVNHLIEDFSTQYSDREIRFRITADNFKDYGLSVLEAFQKEVTEAGFHLPYSYEGVRVRFQGDCNGFMLLRASLHDPVMVLNMEGQTEEDLREITAVAKGLLQNFPMLDISGL